MTCPYIIDNVNIQGHTLTLRTGALVELCEFIGDQFLWFCKFFFLKEIIEAGDHNSKHIVNNRNFNFSIRSIRSYRSLLPCYIFINWDVLLSGK